jgi:hypothetical protein
VAAPADLFETTASFFSDRGLPGGLLTRLFHPSWRLRAGESFRGLDPDPRPGPASWGRACRSRSSRAGRTRASRLHRRSAWRGPWGPPSFSSPMPVTGTYSRRRRPTRS